MTEYVKVSFTKEEIENLKYSITLNSAFAKRISFILAAKLISLGITSSEFESIIREINHLEFGTPSKTKKETEFKYPPLAPLWHKHYFCARNLIRNIGIRWNIERGPGNRDLDTMIRMVTQEHGHDHNLWPKLIAHNIAIKGIEERAEDQRLTGDLIIFAKYKTENYYLDIARHSDADAGEPAEGLYRNLLKSCEAEFPFLFSKTS